jgi:6-phosphogluconate dehydrogenase
MAKQQIGVMGLGVMGKNLALNIESRGYSVSLIDKFPEKTKEILNEATDKQLFGAYSDEEFVNSLEVPRKILMMIKAGEPTDEAIDEISPLLDNGDILIDGGNSFFQDTIKRNQKLENLGIHYIGMGVSGGEEGALKGPSIMPGGQLEAYKLVEPILTAISAKVNGEPCSMYIGSDGAGHYVKMVHNGIEYAIMQLIGEVYHLFKDVLGSNVDELHRVFKEWNKGELDSYLIEITADIFTKGDPRTGKPIVDQIVDVTANNGTGMWTSQSALELGIPLSTIAESVIARLMSSMREERIVASRLLEGPEYSAIQVDSEDYIETVRKALFASIICAYTQGFALMKVASEKYGWHLDYGGIAKIFRGGCIIRARLLEEIKDAFAHEPQLNNLLLASYFREVMGKYQSAWRAVVSNAVAKGVPVPALSSALAYYDSYRTERLPANLLQAQRDYFGAHRFERMDQEGSFHYQWVE